MAYQRIEVLTGSERRRQYTEAEKSRLLDAAFRPGVVVSEAARRLGVHESLLYRWRRLTATAPAAQSSVGFVAVTVAPLLAETSDTEPGPVTATPTASAMPAAAVASMEIGLSCGTRIRLDGAVDPALAAAVVSALVRR